MRWITFGVRVIVGAITFLFWALPAEMHDNGAVMLILGVDVLGVVYLALDARVWLKTWRGLGLLVVAHIAAQAWLQWQWSAWDAPTTLTHHLNVVAALIALATFVAMFVSIVLLLIYRDASVKALSVAVVSFPPMWIGLARYYGTAERFYQAELREQLSVLVPLCLIPFLIFGGALAFLVHLARLIVIELWAAE